MVRASSFSLGMALALSALAGLLSEPADVWAQAAPAAPSPTRSASQPVPRQANEAAFREADKDKDGRLNRAEAEQVPGLAEHFDEVDTDKDGLLAPEEFKRGLTG